MATFRRQRPAAVPYWPINAVPLTPDDAVILVAGLRADDELTQRHRRDISGGLAYARDLAATVSQSATLANHLGHPAAPLLTQELRMLPYVLHTLREYAPRADATVRFAELEAKLQALSGLVGVHDWTVRNENGVWRWNTPPTDSDIPSVPALGNAGRTRP